MFQIPYGTTATGYTILLLLLKLSLSRHVQKQLLMLLDATGFLRADRTIAARRGQRLAVADPRDRSPAVKQVPALRCQARSFFLPSFLFFSGEGERDERGN
jgi:hypothetical protein